MLGTWAKDASGLTAEFTAGQPFPLLVLDDFLEESFAGELVAEFPGIHSMDRSKDYMFGDKREKAAFGGAGPASQRYQDLLLSGEFAGILAEIVGRTLFMDPAFHGGGFHQGGDGSFLDTHVDFNIHPDHKDWLRVLNVLLYLNKDWPA